MKKFCNSLREHTKNIIDFETKKKYVIFVETESSKSCLKL